MRGRPTTAPGFHRVAATAEEVAAWNRKHPNRKGAPGYRVSCDDCGKRLWLSGLGIGAHRRACPGPERTCDLCGVTARQPVWFLFHDDGRPRQLVCAGCKPTPKDATP